MDNIKTGEYIAFCRKRKNMTQQQLADALEITNKAVSKWETGLGMPDISILPDLSRLLGVSIDSIINGEEMQPMSSQGACPEANENASFIVHTIMGLSNMKTASRYIDKVFYKSKQVTLLTAAVLILLLSGVYFILRWVQNTQSNLITYLIPAAGVCAAAGIAIICFSAYLTRAKKEYREIADIEGPDRVNVFSFSFDRFVVNTPLSVLTCTYDKVVKILDLPGLIIIKYQQKYFYLEKGRFQKGDSLTLLSFLRDKCHNAQFYYRAVPSITKRRKIAGSLFGLICICMLLMQAAYLTVGRHYKFVYVYDVMFYIANTIIICTATLSLALLLWHKRKIFVAIIAAGAVLSGGYIYLTASATITTQSIVSHPSDYGNTLVLKRDMDSGKTTIYRNVLLWFARPKEQFPYTTGDNLKIQWLTDDICAVTYVSPDDGETHQYVATYGVRSNGYSYDNVVTALRGGWVSEVSGWEFKVDENGIILKSGSSEESFAFSDSVQFGTIALVLCKDGLPQWTVALNKDVEIGSGDLMEGKGSITVCRVSMEETAPVVFFSTTPEAANPPQNSSKYPDSHEQGEILVDRMKQFFTSSQDLSSIESSWDYAKVTTDSTDMFWVGRLALEEHIKQENRSFGKEVHITGEQILAGDANDYLIEIKGKSTYYDSATDTTSQPADFDQQFRIMKGEGVYLAGRVGPTVDGSVGLTPIGMEQRLDTLENALYRFIVPAISE